MKPEQFTELQRRLLEKNIIDLRGELDMGHATYVRDALFVLLARGSPPCTVFITSPGGGVGVGLSIHDMLAWYEGAVSAVVIGYAGSMAAVVLQACDFRGMLPNARILIHRVNGQQIGLDTLRDKKKLAVMRSVMEGEQKKIDKILTRRTRMGIAQLNELCRRERELDFEEAHRLGLVDSILPMRKSLIGLMR